MKDITKYLNQNKSLSFNQLLFSYIDRSGLTEAEVYKKVYIDRKLFSKIRCDENYIPKKNNIIKLGIALSLNKTELSLLLNSAGYSLSTTNNKIFIICQKKLEKILKKIRKIQ